MKNAVETSRVIKMKASSSLILVEILRSKPTKQLPIDLMAKLIKSTMLASFETLKSLTVATTLILSEYWKKCYKLNKNIIYHLILYLFYDLMLPHSAAQSKLQSNYQAV